MRRAAASAAAIVVALAFAGPASAATFRGTVVHRNHLAHRLVVATRTGRLVSLRTARSVRTGRVVRVSGRSIRVVGRARHVRLRGTVTYVNRHRRTFTLSARGASVLVHLRRLGRTASAADDAMPSSGSQTEVDADVDDQGDLEAQDVNDEGDDTNGIDLEGTIKAVDTNARTLSVSADDDDESGDTVVVTVPSSFDMTQFHVGDEVELVVTKAADGSFTLQSAQSDDDEQGDDNDDESGDHAHGDD